MFLVYRGAAADNIVAIFVHIHPCIEASLMRI